jgi:hypothetical protein
MTLHSWLDSPRPETNVLLPEPNVFSPERSVVLKAIGEKLKAAYGMAGFQKPTERIAELLRRIDDNERSV